MTTEGLTWRRGVDVGSEPERITEDEGWRIVRFRRVQVAVGTARTLGGLYLEVCPGSRCVLDIISPSAGLRALCALSLPH